MSIADKLTQLATIKANIKAAIIAKGQTVTDDMTTYATAIGQISGGGGLSYVETTATTLTPVWDTVYQWTNTPTEITISSPATPSDGTKEIILRFTTGATAPTVSFPNTFRWLGGSAVVTLLADSSYEFSMGYDKAANAVTILCAEYSVSNS